MVLAWAGCVRPSPDQRSAGKENPARIAPSGALGVPQRLPGHFGSLQSEDGGADLY